MLYSYLLGIILCLSGSYAFYDSSEVVELDSSNFKSLVVNSDEIWIVEFYATWCFPSEVIVPEFKKAAKKLKGIANVGAVETEENDDLGDEYDITRYPTVKIFNGGKHKTYKGKISAQGLVNAALKIARKRKSHMGIANVGAVETEENDDLGDEYDITRYPTVKIFNGGKHKTYKGKLSAQGLVNAALKIARKRKSHMNKRFHHRNRYRNRYYGRQLVSPQMSSASRELRFNSSLTNESE